MTNPAYMLQNLNRFIPLIPAYLLAAAFAWGLKAYYSQAGSEQLNWILMPTAWLVQGLTGIAFVHEAHSGYVSLQKGLMIAPACAGINFFIIVFCLSAFSFLHRFKRFQTGLLWLLGGLLISYGLTLGVNTLRISLAIFLYGADIYGDWITPQRIHRLSGILVYLGAIFVWHAFLNRLLDRRQHPTTGKVWHLGCRNAIPVFWYGSIAVVVPLVNLAFQNNYLRFMEHVGIISAVCLGLWLGITLLQLSYQKIQAKIKDNSKHNTLIDFNLTEDTEKP